MKSSATVGTLRDVRPVRLILQRGGVYLALAVLLVISGIISPPSVTVSHLLEVAQVASFLGIAAIGETLVILTGGLDLSTGGNITLVGIIASAVMNGQDSNTVPMVAICLALGLGIGIVNGLLVTQLRINAFIATLGTNAILFGAGLIYSGGAPRGSISSTFHLGIDASIAGVPVTVVMCLVLGALAIVVLRATVWGRHLFLTGANPRAAILSGINVGLVVTLAYMACGLTAALTGLLLTGYVGTAALGLGNDYILNTVAAVIIGGTAFEGGRGSIAGSLAGAFFLSLLYSVTNMIHVPIAAEEVLQGVIIAGGVALYTRSAVGTQ